MQVSMRFGLMLVVACSSAYASPAPLDSSDVIFHFSGADTNSRVGQFLTPVGDINSDGFDDIAISCRKPYGTFIFLGYTDPDAVPDMKLRGNSAVVGDFTGDGILEILTTEESPCCSQELPCCPDIGSTGKLLFYRGYGDSLASQPYESLSTNSPNYGFGLYMHAGYFDSDSTADILVNAPWEPGGSHLFLFSGANLSAPIWEVKVPRPLNVWDGIGFIDFNADGNTDIFVSKFPSVSSNIPHIDIYYGPVPDSGADLLIGDPIYRDSNTVGDLGRWVVNLDDVDLDNFEELAVYFDGQFYLYRSGPNPDSIPDYILEGLFFSICNAGDINGDGDTDILTGSFNHSIWGGIEVFLAGVEFDERFDGYLYTDDLPPESMEQIGYVVSPAGDFNGDGVEDMVFSAKDLVSTPQGQPGHVFVIKGGQDIVTGVRDISNDILPSRFELHQNYPNPFNPATTISFSLTSTESVSIEICNAIGNIVANPIVNRKFGKGHHSIEWSAMTDSGRMLPSGLYLCRLKVGIASQSCKMLIIR